MGANFVSACHRCKVYTSHLRSPSDVGKTLTQFFHDHYDCGKANPGNVTVHWDYFEEPDIYWDDAGYTNQFDKYYPQFKEVKDEKNSYR